MRTALFIFVILFLVTSLAYAMGERPAKIEELQMDNFELINFKVEGITCPSCIVAIRNALQKVPEVKKAEVNLRGETKVYAAKGRVSLNTLIKAVEKAGYKARLVE